jgi:hypothetical protein
MKYLKLYEELNKEPEINDYVIGRNIRKLPTTGPDKDADEIDEYLKTHIGQIINIQHGQDFLVKYDDGNSWWFKKFELIHISKNKNDLEIYIEAEKYNL